ncbi:sulfatase-like hydrolase/transferase [Bradyrhizobium jicamae]|uniref:sulfatase-like hydrolase/transferase n=1 Tax=Bradyrhizobium jicamae TaxID=280332 RepID=UPI001BAAD05F|nr:sulfatase-like hydrolase/transferase [Bradyrhizobium jicamae]MBR0754876.1 sulfatase-like hydrolase/transferase [Bradyrhizobium jicamae]
MSAIDKSRRDAGRDSFLLHLALSAIAIAQPFFSVTGRDLNFFVAWRMSGLEYSACVLLIYLGPPVITWLLVRVGYRLHRTIGRVLAFLAFGSYIAAACVVGALQIANGFRVVPGNGVALGIGAALLVVSVSLATLLLANRTARGCVRMFAVLTLIFPVTMLTSGYTFGVIEFTKVEPAPKYEIANQPNVIFIVYDELPLSTILDANGLIDRAKFPNLHAFADGATWLANAYSRSGSTETAVPAVLSGLLRTRIVPPTFKMYPHNIFQQLGPSYNVLDLQIATDLNPLRQPGEEDTIDDERERLRHIADDVATIYAHLIAPPTLAAQLPPIDTQHNRFGEDVLKSTHGARHSNKFIATLDKAKPPFLAVYHNIYPHNSWTHYPSGQSYPRSRWGEYLSLEDRNETQLAYDGSRIMHDVQAQLLQSMHADKLFGEVIAKLKATGQYDNSIIIMTADHGVALWPGERPRNPVAEEHAADVYNVPLLVKLPNQKQSGVVQEPIDSTDIYPTVLDYLGIAPPADVRGTSFLAALRAATPGEAVSLTSHRDDPTVKRKLEWFGTGTSIADLYGFGRFAAEMGRDVGSFELSSIPEAHVSIFRNGKFSRAAAPLSARIDAEISGGPQDGQKRDILIALSNRICGAARTTDLVKSGKANAFTLIVAEPCLDLLDKNQIRVFVPGPAGHLAEMTVDSGQEFTPKTIVDQTIEQIAILLDRLAPVETASQGQMTPQQLRDLGVDMPAAFQSGGEFAWRWGDVDIIRDGHKWVVDLYSAPKDVCEAIEIGAGQFPAVARIAASGRAADETRVPVSAEQARAACSNTESDVVRLITVDTPARRLPSTTEVLERLGLFVDHLARVQGSSPGRVPLATLRGLGVAVPDMFVTDDRLAWPWGNVTVQQDGAHWILDLSGVPKQLCRDIQLGAGQIRGIARIAASDLAKDEASVPVTPEHAEATCGSSTSDMIRIITTDAPLAPGATGN